MPKPLAPPRSRSARRGVLILLLVGAVFALSLIMGRSDRPPVRQVSASTPFHAIPVAASIEEGSATIIPASLPEPFSLGKGQTLGRLLRELGLSGQEVHRATTALASELDPRKVRAGQAGLAYYSPEGELAALRFELHRRGRLTLDRDAAGEWTTSFKEYEQSTRRQSISGSLESFLFHDVERAGGVPAVAVAMSNVLQWDLDFNRDLRKGDRFQVLYEERLLDRRYDGVGRILALVYENRGVRHEAYLHEHGEDGKEGYYDAEGRPLQKMFLKSPLPFMRVTSRFSHNRFHPVLKRNRPHYGIDLGAPRGTPVRVTATGSVTFAGRQGGAGNMVKVRHPNGFETLYLHLSGFAKGVRRGAKVRQGDVIGYVGSTGLSTGPHLDYRVKRNRRYLNPLRLENRPAEPIDADELPRFLEARDQLRLAMVDGVPEPSPVAPAPAPEQPEAEARIAAAHTAR